MNNNNKILNQIKDRLIMYHTNKITREDITIDTIIDIIFDILNFKNVKISKGKITACIFEKSISEYSLEDLIYREKDLRTMISVYKSALNQRQILAKLIIDIDLYSYSKDKLVLKFVRVHKRYNEFLTEFLGKEDTISDILIAHSLKLKQLLVYKNSFKLKKEKSKEYIKALKNFPGQIEFYQPFKNLIIK